MNKEVQKYIDLVGILEELDDKPFFKWYEEKVKSGFVPDEELNEYVKMRLMRYVINKITK